MFFIRLRCKHEELALWRILSIKQGTARKADYQSMPAIEPSHYRQPTCKHANDDQNIDKKMPKYTAETRLLLLIKMNGMNEINIDMLLANAVFAYFQLMNYELSFILLFSDSLDKL